MNFVQVLPIILLVLILVVCVGCNREGFIPAPVDGSYKVSDKDGEKLESVEKDYTPMETQGFLPTAGVLDPNYPVLKPENGELFPFADSQCKPECCKNGGEFSCNNGCVCLTKEQKELLLTRGGNRTRVGNNF